jgi:molecular chaperone GrpE
MAKKKSDQDTLEKEELKNEDASKTANEEEKASNNSSDEKTEEKNNENTINIEDNLSEEEESYKIQLQRLQAEFLNFKKRTEKEKMELSQFVKVEFIKRFLPAIDDIFRLDQFKEKEDKSLADGIDLVIRKIDDFFKQEKLEQFAEVGDDFNPELHEALMQQPVENEKDDEKILNVFEKGFKLGDKIIRYAKVQVGKKM